MDLIDFDKGTTIKLGSSKFEDIAGSISPDGKTAAWIDTRDPGQNGAVTTYLDPSGGEVYIRDLVSGNDTRHVGL
ncbi:MAG: PD40 domain-containing protein [Myxococcales bacterium]|nr:PD40 domain-containing protein [Myxococcales bacterium]